MTDRSGPPDPDGRAAAHRVLDEWLDALESPAREPTLGDLGQRFDARRDQLLGPLLAWRLREQVRRLAQGVSSCACPGCGRTLEAARLAKRTVPTLHEPVEIERPVFPCPGCGGRGTPVDDALGLAREVVAPEPEGTEASPGGPGASSTGQPLGWIEAALTGSDGPKVAARLREMLRPADVLPGAAQLAVSSGSEEELPAAMLVVPRAPAHRDGARGFDVYRARRATDPELVAVWRTTEAAADAAAREALVERLEGASRVLVVPDRPDGSSELLPAAGRLVDVADLEQAIRSAAVARYGDGARADQWSSTTAERLEQGAVASVLGGLNRMKTENEAAILAIGSLREHLEGARESLEDDDCRRWRRAVESEPDLGGLRPLPAVGDPGAGEPGNEDRERNELLLRLRCAARNGTLEERVREMPSPPALRPRSPASDRVDSGRSGGSGPFDPGRTPDGRRRAAEGAPATAPHAATSARRRALVLAGGVLVALLLVVVAFLPDRSSRSGTSGPDASSQGALASRDVVRLTIAPRRGTPFELERVGPGAWSAVGVGLPVDHGAVGNLLDALTGRDGLEAPRPEGLPDLEVVLEGDGRKVRFVLWDPEGDRASGLEAEVAPTSGPVEDRIVLLQALAESPVLLSAEASRWLRRPAAALLRYESGVVPSEVRALQIGPESDRPDWRLVRQGDGFLIEEPVREPAVTEPVAALLDALSALRIAEFLAVGEEMHRSLERPVRSVTAELSGRDGPLRIDLFEPDDEGLRARVDGLPVRLDGEQLWTALGAEGWRSRRWTESAVGDIRALRMRVLDGPEVAARREGDAWSVASHPAAVAVPLLAILDLEVGPEDLSATGSSAAGGAVESWPLARLELELESGEVEVLVLEERRVEITAQPPDPELGGWEPPADAGRTWVAASSRRDTVLLLGFEEAQEVLAAIRELEEVLAGGPG